MQNKIKNLIIGIVFTGIITAGVIYAQTSASDVKVLPEISKDLVGKSAVYYNNTTQKYNFQTRLKTLGVATTEAKQIDDYFQGKKEYIEPTAMMQWITACDKAMKAMGIADFGQLTNPQHFIKKCNYLIEQWAIAQEIIK